jgi:phosphoribosylformylglycinamidine synthase
MKVDRAETLARPETPQELRATLLRMAASPNLCDKSWVTEQYDRYVLGNTVLAQPEDCRCMPDRRATGLGVALSVDGNGRYARLDPYAGARLALRRGVPQRGRHRGDAGGGDRTASTSARRRTRRDVAVRRGGPWLADGCQELGIPVTGGNVSFYNQTGGTPIHPTPIVGVAGILSNVAQRGSDRLLRRGRRDLPARATREELSGSEWAHVTHNHLGGAPPSSTSQPSSGWRVCMAEAAANGHLTAAHDLSDGGLAQALVEACLRRNMGAHIGLPPDQQSPFVHLFSESTARVLVSVRKGQEQAFVALAAQRGVPYTALGIVAGTSLVFDEPLRGEPGRASCRLHAHDARPLRLIRTARRPWLKARDRRSKYAHFPKVGEKKP